jgi:hypothetical protein
MLSPCLVQKMGMVAMQYLLQAVERVSTQSICIPVLFVVLAGYAGA